MYKRITAAVLLLALTLSTLILAVPAQAVALDAVDPAASKLTISAQSGPPEDPNQIIHVDHQNLAGRQITLQMADGKTWQDVAMQVAGGDRLSFTRKYLAPGTRQYRAVVLAADGVAAVSNSVKITYMTNPQRPDMTLSATRNTLQIKVAGGRGLVIKLFRTDSGRQLIWSSGAPAATSSYTLNVPVDVTRDGPVSIEAIGTVGTTEVASGNLSFWGYTPVRLGLTDTSQPHAQKKEFAFTGDLQAGSVVTLQRHNGSAWTNVWTSKPLQAGQKNPTAAYVFPAEAKASFRAVQTRSGKTIATTASVTAAYTRMATSPRSTTYGDLFDRADGRVAAKNSVSQTYFLDYTLTDRTGYFQEFTGGRWVNLNKLTFKKSAGYPHAAGVTVSTPVTHATVTRKYRVTIPETATQKGWTSKTAVIQHMNPLHYTGYKRTAYNYMKAYCPNQVINLIGGWTSYAYSGSQRIEMSTQLGTGKVLQYVALHECAHIRQFKLYNNDFQTMQPRLNAIFGGTGSLGMERAADCMAYAMGADSAYGGSYWRTCSSAQVSAARKMLAGIMP